MSRLFWARGDEGIKWLQNNDEIYKSKAKNKGLEYPYLTPDREKRIRRREVYQESDTIDYFNNKKV